MTRGALRDGPLPRMAGRLSFLRAREGAPGDVGPGMIAVMGAPWERSDAAAPGCALAPLGLRETSVYFGWSANPQFSRPVAIDARATVDASALGERLRDIGDLRLAGLDEAAMAARVAAGAAAATASGGAAVVLGGDAAVAAPAALGAASGAGVAVAQLGGDLSTLAALDAAGQLRCALLIAPARPLCAATVRRLGGRLRVIWAAAARETPPEAWAGLDVGAAPGGLHVALEMSALDSVWHGMSAPPRFGGLDLPSLAALMAALGAAGPRTLTLTGLNVALSGFGVVKTGQRLAVTALLPFLDARLVAGAAAPARVPA